MSSVLFDHEQLDAIFAPLGCDQLPGVAVGVAIDGKPVYRKGFGLASLELPVALSPTIRMPIGSATKHFASLAFMLQCEDGKASIDDTIGKFLPELNPVVHDISMRQLMGHLGGLRDAVEIGMLFGGIRTLISLADVLSLYRKIDDLNTEPGAAFIYNNGGYLIMSAVIERIADRPLEDVLRDRIFEPTGMYDTRLRRFDSDFLPNCVTLHPRNGSGQFERMPRCVEGVGQGGIYSTIDDMLRWLAHMEAPTVGTPMTWQVLRTPQTLNNGVSTGYGLGLMLGQHRGMEWIGHSGAVFGGNSQMLKIPAARLDIVVMANRQDLSAVLLALKILDACLPGLDSIEEAPDLPLATGIFRSPATGRVIQLFARGGQQIVSVDGVDIPVRHDSQGVLTPMPGGIAPREMVTLVGDRGRPDSIKFDDYGVVEEFMALPATEEGGLPAIAGRYVSSSTGAEMTISGSAAYCRADGLPGSASYELEHLAGDVWRARATDSLPFCGILSFEPTRRQFHFFTGRTRALEFERCR